MAGKSDKEKDQAATEHLQPKSTVDPATLANLETIEQELTIEGEDENEQVMATVERDAAAKQQSAQEKQARENGAILTAAGAVVIAEQLVQFKYSYVRFSDEEKAHYIEQLKPLVLKYKTDLPEWLQPWKEEFQALSVVGSIGFTTFMQIQTYKKAEREMAEKNAQKPPADGSHQSAKAPPSQPKPGPQTGADSVLALGNVMTNA